MHWPREAACSQLSALWLAGQAQAGRRSWLPCANQSLWRQLQCHHSLKKKAVNSTTDKARDNEIPSLLGKQTFSVRYIIVVGAGSGLPQEGNEQHTPLAEPKFPFWHIAWDAFSSQFEMRA